MKFAIYRQRDFQAQPRAVLRNGKPVTFKTKKAAEAWLAESNLTSKVPSAVFYVRRFIKEVKS